MQNANRNTPMRLYTHLMSHVVLHVHMATTKDFQAKGTKQVFSVFMNCAEMIIHIREEGGPVVTNLQENKNKVRTKYSKYKLHRALMKLYLTGIRHLSRFVIVPHVL